MPRIDVTKFIQTVRPSNPEALTPVDLQWFLLFQIGEAAKLVPLVLEARGLASNDAEYRTVEAISDDLREFQDRLNGYLEYINGAIADGRFNDPEAAQPVVRPLLRGRFPNSFKLPDGKRDGLCFDTTKCYDTVPDIANLVIIRNELTEYGIFEEYQQKQLLRDITENAKALGVTPVSAADIEEFFSSGSSKTPSWKWALYGFGAGIGAIALFKILR